MTEIAEWIALARDVVLLVLLMVMLLVILKLYFNISSVLGSAKRAVKAAEEIVTTVSGSVIGPVAAGSGVAFGAGKAMAFLMGLSKRRKKGESDDG